jgi:hypothetical protein
MTTQTVAEPSANQQFRQASSIHASLLKPSAKDRYAEVFKMGTRPGLEHDPEKRIPVFRKDHAQTKG